MRKSFYVLCTLAFFSFIALTSCEESEGYDQYANWKERNDAFLDSIYNVAKDNANSDWRIYKAWNMPPDTGEELGGRDKNNYIYAKVLESGSGEPGAYTDSVSINYKGKLINGLTFIAAYSLPDPDPNFVTPQLNYIKNAMFMPTSTGTTSYANHGVTTALQHMREGDRWLIYVPAKLGYGEKSSMNSIHNNSVLIFDMQVVEIFPGKNKDTN